MTAADNRGMLLRLAPLAVALTAVLLLVHSSGAGPDRSVPGPLRLLPPPTHPELLPPGTNPSGRLPPVGAAPALGPARYVFPVSTAAGVADTFGAARAGVSFHHGDDIFALAGTPLVAVADGVVFGVGWNGIGGRRLWLVDREGNEFYYAHLAAFSSLAVEGGPVRAGEVLGFVGDSGDAEGTPPHLHFEVHPVAYLDLGYDGAVDPTSYLRSWLLPPEERGGQATADRRGK